MGDSHSRLALRFSRSGVLGDDVTLLDVARSPLALADYEYFISIQCSLLPFRVMGSTTCRIIFEPYFPQRFAHQFGYDQTIPSLVWFPADLSADLRGLARCWSFLLARDTHSSFTIIRSFRPSQFSGVYRRWYSRAIASIHVISSTFESMLAEGAQRSARRKKKKGGVMEFPDFAGREDTLKLTALPFPHSSSSGNLHLIHSSVTS